MSNNNMNTEFKKYNWEEYKQMLERYGYNDEQIAEVKKIREDSNYEEMSQEQFRFLFLNGIIKRTRKLKKIRTLLVNEEGQILYLEHHKKAYEFCGYFLNE
jgi:hypothetical protein